jgi:hypothetical protein
MKHVFIAWFWMLLGVYFAIASNGGSEIAPFAALSCGYMAGRELTKEQRRGR